MSLLGPTGDALRRLLAAPRRRRERRNAAWAELAAAHGGRFEGEQGPFVQGARSWRWRSPRAEFEVEGVLLRLELSLRSVGNTVVVYTRLEGGYLLGRGPKFRAYPATGISKLAERLGFDDRPTGDEAFDRRFVLRGGARVARAAWTPTARAAAARALSRTGAEVSADGRRVGLDLLGMVDDPSVLAAATTMVAELASYGTGALAALRSARGVVVEPAGGAFGQRTPPHARFALAELTPAARGDRDAEGSVVRGALVVDDAEVRVRLSTPLTRDAGAFAFSADTGGELRWSRLDHLGEGVLGPEAARRVALLGVLEVSSDGRLVEVELAARAQEDGPRVRAAAELVALLARGEPRSGAFR